MEPVPTISIVTLFLNADIVVKGVLLLLFVASVWSWAVIVEKWWRVGAASRSARVHEARAVTARAADELWAEGGQAGDPAAHILTAGFEESRMKPSCVIAHVAQRSMLGSSRRPTAAWN